MTHRDSSLWDRGSALLRGDAVSGAGDAFAYARSLIGSEWQGTTADAFVSAAGRSVQDCDELGDMITSISSAITDYGYALASVQGKMANIRAQGHGDDDKITAQDAGNIYTLFSNALQGGIKYPDGRGISNGWPLHGDRGREASLPCHAIF